MTFDWLDTAVGVLAGVAVTAFGVYINYLTQTRLSDREQRRRTYYRLTGHRSAAVQYFKLKHQAEIRTIYYNCKRLVHGACVGHVNFLAYTERYRDEANAMIPRAADSRRDLLEVLASVRVLFSGPRELDQLLHDIDKGLEPLIVAQPEWPIEFDLDKWWKDEDERLEQYIVEKINKPLGNLLSAMRSQL